MTRAHWTLELASEDTLELGPHPLVMGVINLTPDSFSDGGRWRSIEHAVEGALQLLAAGADIVDLGAESTRPGGGVYGDGAAPVTAPEELRRLIPVLDRLRDATRAPISIDTRKAEVAREALAAGADLLNDVGGLRDPAYLDLAAETGAPVVLMHSRGELPSMQRGISFTEVVSEVAAELGSSLDRAVAHGVRREQLVVDPGIGFGKTTGGNLALLRRLDALSELGRPILVGASRKSFIGSITGEPPGERLYGSLAAAAWAARSGAAILRVHDVAPTVSFLSVWHAIDEAAP